VLSGGAGDDTMGGAQGVDKLTGGDGNDTFNFYGLANEKVDEIADFSNDVGNNDILAVFTGGIFVGLAPGSLVQSQFRSRNDNLAQDADDRFIFNTANNTLYFDSDGTGGRSSAVAIAVFTGTAPGLTAADFLIV
jgi:Ca2+-binding RTX toxin-like protein